MISYTPKNGAKPMVGKPPAGRYVVEIREMQSERAGNNSCDRLSFKFEIVEGTYKGKVIWSKLNLNHESADNSGQRRRWMPFVTRCVSKVLRKKTLQPCVTASRCFSMSTWAMNTTARFPMRLVHSSR